MSFSENGQPLFIAVVLGNHLNRSSVETSIRSFSRFYHSLTPKHHGRVKFLLLDAPPEIQPILAQKNKETGFAHPVFLFEKSSANQLPKKFAEQNNLLFHPEKRDAEQTRIALLSMRLPILTFGSWEQAHSFDSAAAVFLNSDFEEQAVREFSALIRNLYFDPGAFNMLKNKALRQRRSAGQLQTV